MSVNHDVPGKKKKEPAPKVIDICLIGTICLVVGIVIGLVI